jgi:hypothetical protein
MSIFLLFIADSDVLSFFGLRPISVGYRYAILLFVALYLAIAFTWERISNFYLRKLANSIRSRFGYFSFLESSEHDTARRRSVNENYVQIHSIA